MLDIISCFTSGKSNLQGHKAIFQFYEEIVYNLPRKILHVVFDDYSSTGEKVLNNNWPEYISEPEIYDLSQQFLKVAEWQGFNKHYKFCFYYCILYHFAFRESMVF